jgi:enterochelin esterase-like enzyme
MGNSFLHFRNAFFVWTVGLWMPSAGVFKASDFHATHLAAHSASAQPPPSTQQSPQQSVPQLRQRLAQLKAAAQGRSTLPDGVWESVGYTLDVAARIEKGYAAQSKAWRARAHAYMNAIEQGDDPFLQQKGKLVSRGYWSSASTIRQGYTIYIPPDFDPRKRYPLMVVLHGGSSNGNLFLGVVMGNNMNWLEYPKHLWDDYAARWTPDWIVVAPDGFGQVMWRWMGEKDVLDVIDDVQKHYPVDADRVVLCGLSNGGVGAHSIGMRHASRFSAVLALAGAPSWLQYTGGSPSDAERILMQRVSGLSLVDNAWNTQYRVYHGNADPGPMKPRFVQELEATLKQRNIPHSMKWLQAGHDILYMVHKHGRIYHDLASIRRANPTHVVVTTGDYRASKQHWVSVTRIEKYPRIGNVTAILQGDTLSIQTSSVRAFTLHVAQAPWRDASRLTWKVDGAVVWQGDPRTLGNEVGLIRRDSGWALGLPDERAKEKKPGVSGPLTDAYYGHTVHVFGTQNPADTEALRAAAEQGSRGWPLWLWNFKQRVLADTEVTPELMQQAHVVLYATPGSNRVLESMAAELPIRVRSSGVMMGEQTFEGADVGVRFVYPNPKAPHRYVIVQAGSSAAAVRQGHNLPDFVPDFVVYNGKSTRSRPRLIANGNKPLAAGFFNDQWGLSGGALNHKTTPASASAEPITPRDARSPHGEVPAAFAATLLASSLPVPPAPAHALATTPLLMSATDPTWPIAHAIRSRVAKFQNFRAYVPGATWVVDEGARWSIRPHARCLENLTTQGVSFVPADPLPTPVPSPVRLTGKVDGVAFQTLHEGRPVVIACEMAARLPALAATLKKHEITQVGVMSSYRDTPWTSFHTFGLALDLAWFQTASTRYHVAQHFTPTPDEETCPGSPQTHPPASPSNETKRQHTLRAVVCDVWAGRTFSSVLTPNYNVGHRDHIHLDIRPDDPRLFLR